MKRRVYTALALILALLLVFSGCSASSAEAGTEASTGESDLPDLFQSEPEPLRICVDIDFTQEKAFQEEYGAEVKSIAQQISAMGGPQNIVVEALPREEAARKSMMTRIRTEMMSGEGPDVFVMMCGGGPWNSTCETLFPIPEKAMENSLFLPLDDYIENAQFMEWDKLIPQIMAAGRNDEGQLILPMSYTLPITFYRAEDMSEKPGAETTWKDMLQDETGLLYNAATWFHGEGITLSFMQRDYLEYTFGTLADYQNETLLFTEEELLARTYEILEMEKQSADGQLPEAPAHYQTTLAIDYNNGNTRTQYSYSDDIDPFSGIRPTESVTMVPIYTEDGGTTASVVSWAAININTERAEDAFYVVDYLLSREVQQSSALYQNWLTSDTAEYGLPTHMDLLQPKVPFCYTDGKSFWYLTQDNYEELRRIHGQITHTRFRGGLDIELEQLYRVCSAKYISDPDRAGSIEDYVTEYYSRMERLLGE